MQCLWDVWTLSVWARTWWFLVSYCEIRRGPDEKWWLPQRGGSKKCSVTRHGKFVKQPDWRQVEIYSPNKIWSRPTSERRCRKSAKAYEELQSLASTLIQDRNGHLEMLPSWLARFSFWQRGSGQHSSAKIEIFLSVALPVLSNAGAPTLIRYAALENPAQWMAGRNVAKTADTLQKKIWLFTNVCRRWKYSASDIGWLWKTFSLSAVSAQTYYFCLNTAPFF